MPRRGEAFTVFTAQAINEANPNLLGVKLGRICVARQIPMKDVAQYLGVSYPTVYKWFTGKADVNRKYFDQIEKLVEKLA